MIRFIWLGFLCSWDVLGRSRGIVVASVGALFLEAPLCSLSRGQSTCALFFVPIWFLFEPRCLGSL